ncbi:ABC transporter permease subunit [Alteromonas sp. a30]|uniref:ABC transporter permease subunit n=1 Tax=Alteromonas sp. a30 TaxID=2730917 RepID=UPI00227E22E8|nr:ABC transporter permease subunit [Alteromonas sp. a30]MCY7296030.1 ABC transporter permease subunit [Alteromonas sp. a30]
MQQHALNKQLQRRLKRDRNASWLIHFGGWLVLAALLVLLWHLISVVSPMASHPEIVASDKRTMPFAGDWLYATQTQSEHLFVLRQDDCSLVFYRQAVHDIHPTQLQRFPTACDTRSVIHEYQGYHYLSQINSDHILRVKEITFMEDSVFLEQVFSERLPNLILTDETQWQLVQQKHKWGLLLSDPVSSQVYWLDPQHQQKPVYHYYANVKQIFLLPDNAEIMLHQGNSLRLLNWQNQVIWEDNAMVADTEKVFLAPTPSGKGFFLQRAEKAFEKWVFTHSEDKVKFELAYQFTGDAAAIGKVYQVFFISPMHLSILVSQQGITLMNFTTAEILHQQSWASLGVNSDSVRLYWHGNQLAARDHHALRLFDVSKAKSSVTLLNLFSKLWYEGYAKPDYVWQSSAGADNYQTKFSVVPLIIGSIKAAVLAILVALPLGLGAAVYTAYFASSKSRKWLKPSIEMLEAIPSVVIGFIAAIWLLPLGAESLAGVVGFILLLPLYAVGMVLLHRIILSTTGKSIPISLPAFFVYLLGFAVLLSLVVPWLMQTLTALSVPSLFFVEEQDTHSKNTVVIALALGVAIAPSIYSLAEDAIYEVPVSLKRASYALGATRLQTLLNVVLKVAYPGIVSALMLGFSRALGETMILLMVTGNTPIAEWDLMEGMRSLTANLAIELPESEVGGMHYQVLFFTALLLLVFTMGINTVAELLRLRLKKKYRHD